MEDFWRDFTSTPHHLPSSSSSSPPSASKLHDLFIQPLPSGSSSSASVTDPSFASSAHKRPSDESGGDRRSKCMIKNRESAARSRARKQAYTNELEQMRALLKAENAMLIKQLQQLDEDPETNKHKLKKPPYRSLTAPF